MCVREGSNEREMVIVGIHGAKGSMMRWISACESCTVPWFVGSFQVQRRRFWGQNATHRASCGASVFVTVGAELRHPQDPSWRLK